MFRYHTQSDNFRLLESAGRNEINTFQNSFSLFFRTWFKSEREERIDTMILNTVHSALGDRLLVFHEYCSAAKQICCYHDYHTFIITIINKWLIHSYSNLIANIYFTVNKLLYKTFIKQLFSSMLHLMFIILCKWLINTLYFIYKHYLDGCYIDPNIVFKPLQLLNKRFF